MSGRRPLIALLCLGFLLWSVPAWAGATHAADDDLRDRWIPSLTFDVLLHDWEEEGSLDTPLADCSKYAPDSENIPCLYSLSGSSESQVGAVQYRVGLDLMSPRIDFLSFIFSPRAWIFGGILINPKQSHQVMTRPNKGRFVPRQPEDEVKADFGPPLTGIAAEIQSGYLETGWFVGLGSVFELPYRNSMFRIKFGVNYMRERVRVDAQLAAVKGATNSVPGADYCQPGGFTRPYVCEVVRDQLGKNKMYHYLGPIGELEMVLVPGKNITFSIYGQTQFLWNLDPSAIVFVSDVSDVKSTYTYRPDDFAVRGTIGIRMAWAPRFGF